MRPLRFGCVLALVGCGTEYNLSTLTEPELPAGVVEQGQRAPADAADAPSSSSAPTPQDDEEGEVDFDHGPRVRRPRADVVAEEVPFGGGARVDMVDFLFVVDGSASMKTVVDRVYAGFDALVDEDAFPRNARIAVTSTLPADPDRLRQPHLGVRHRGKVKYDPGFQRLVDRAGIARVGETFPELAQVFELQGCNPWFAPDEDNADGFPCFQAHTQLTLAGVGVEAGLTAANQLLARGPLFRTGAAANIVFVSDTQDPGIPSDDPAFAPLVELRPTGPELQATAAGQQLTASLRLHAIAPEGTCGERHDHIGDVYGEAARATDGLTMDICAAEPGDYVEMVRSIVEKGSVPTDPVLPLGNPDRVRAVFVDGAEVGYHLSRDKKAVVLDQPVPAQRSTVRIEYKRMLPQAQLPTAPRAVAGPAAVKAPVPK